MSISWILGRETWKLGRKCLSHRINHQHVNTHSLGQVHGFKCVATCSDLIPTPVRNYEIQAILRRKNCLYAVKENYS